jgi:hypothetical protein
MNWIYLGQDRVQLRAIVNTIMNLWAPLKVVNVVIK